MASLDLDFQLLRCEEHITDLTRRINQLIETAPSLGSGMLASPEYIELLQKTLESWRERKRTLVASPSDHSGAGSRL